MNCPFCNKTLQTYTDPQLQVRCAHCFNHIVATPGVPMGRMQDLDAPMVIVGNDGHQYVYPGAYTRYDLSP